MTTVTYLFIVQEIIKVQAYYNRYSIIRLVNHNVTTSLIYYDLIKGA